MGLPNLNNIQRILLIASAVTLLFIQVEKGFEEGYIASLIISTLLFVIAFSGGVKILIPSVVRLMTIIVLIISLIGNITQYSFNKESRELKARYDSCVLSESVNEQIIQKLKHELETAKKLNSIFKTK